METIKKKPPRAFLLLLFLPIFQFGSSGVGQIPRIRPRTLLFEFFLRSFVRSFVLFVPSRSVVSVFLFFSKRSTMIATFSKFTCSYEMASSLSSRLVLFSSSQQGLFFFSPKQNKKKNKNRIHAHTIMTHVSLWKKKQKQTKTSLPYAAKITHGIIDWLSSSNVYKNIARIWAITKCCTFMSTNWPYLICEDY